MAAAQRHFLDAEYDEYAATNASGAAFFRYATLALLALLLLRHALSITGLGDDDDTYFSQRRQRQEAAALAAAEVAFILQSGQAGSLQFAIAPEPPATPQQEPHQQISSTSDDLL